MKINSAFVICNACVFLLVFLEIFFNKAFNSIWIVDIILNYYIFYYVLIYPLFFNKWYKLFILFFPFYLLYSFSIKIYKDFLLYGIFFGIVYNFINILFFQIKIIILLNFILKFYNKDMKIMYVKKYFIRYTLITCVLCILIDVIYFFVKQ